MPPYLSGPDAPFGLWRFFARIDRRLRSVQDAGSTEEGTLESDLGQLGAREVRSAHRSLDVIVVATAHAQLAIDEVERVGELAGEQPIARRGSAKGSRREAGPSRRGSTWFIRESLGLTEMMVPYVTLDDEAAPGLVRSRVAIYTAPERRRIRAMMTLSIMAAEIEIGDLKGMAKRAGATRARGRGTRPRKQDELPGGSQS